MNLVWATLVIAVVAALAVAAMLLVRRGAPDGSRFTDGDRASGVFGVLATGFSVLLGLVVFLAFESYDQSRSGAEEEALVVLQQVETAQFLGQSAADDLAGDLICYGRSVVHVEWPRAESGNLGEEISPWGVRMFRTLQTVDIKTPGQEAAYGKWLDQTSDREAARIDRIHGVGVIPTPLWVVLFFISAVIFVFMLFFADRSEGAVTQAVLMGSVAAVVVTMLLLIRFLDSPFHEGVGGVQPVAMERTLRIVDEALRAADATVAPPCDERGAPTS